MSLHAAYSEPSDEERLNSPSERHASVDRASRRRSTRACDQCRRTKSKCERDKSASTKQACRGCVALGLSCTYAGPSHKRGPPKGYILAIERRLHQVEALLGTIIGSDDPRARGLLQDLSQDQLASQIIQRVDVGPFGPKGRVAHPFGSTKEDFLASIMTGIGEDISDSSKSNQVSPPRSDSLALVSPSSSWQDNLQRLLLPRAPGSNFPQNATDTGNAGVSSPDPRTRRASFPLMSNHIAFPSKAHPISPMVSLSSLASFPSSSGVDRMGWDSLEGLEKIDSESGDSDDLDIKMPPQIEDVYVDQDTQMRIANRISGLQILSQCQRILTGRREQQLECPWPLAERRIDQIPDLSSMLPNLPAEREQHSLIQSFFSYAHPMFPVINRACFTALYNQKLNSGVQGSSALSEIVRISFDALLLAVFSVASRHIESQSGEQDSSDYAVESLKLIASTAGQSHPLLCQALLLLGYRSVGMGFVEAAWMYIGMAIRMAESLGIHRAVYNLTAPASGLVTKDEQQMRQQIWACCLIADRYVSVLLGRPSAVRATDFDTPPVDTSQLRDEDTVFYALPHEFALRTEQVSETTVLLCLNGSRALSSIIASIMDELYAIAQPVESVLEIRAKHLEYRLSQWRQSLPPPLHFDQSRISVLPPPCVLELHIQYWWAIILLYRAFVHGPLSRGFYSGPEGMQSKALGLCRDAAGQISSILTVMQNQPMKFMSAFLPGYLFATGIIDVLTLSILRHDDMSSARLRSTMASLRRIEMTWSMARVVQNLLDRTISPSSTTPAAAPSSPTRSKRPARDVFSDDEHAERSPKKMPAPSNSAHFVKDTGHAYDSLGRMLGLDTGLGFITSQPYPGFQYRSPSLESPTAVHSFQGVGYGAESFPTVTSSSPSFGIW